MLQKEAIINRLPNLNELEPILVVMECAWVLDYLIRVINYIFGVVNISVNHFIDKIDYKV